MPKHFSAKTTDTVYVLLLAFMGAVLTWLFHMQCIRYKGVYISDTYVYAQQIGDIEKSRMIAWVFARLNALDSSYYAISVFMALVVVATVVAGYYLLFFLLERENCTVQRWVLQLASFCVLFSGPIYLPVVSPHFYSETWSKYAWHSPTEMAMVLFSIVSIYFFVKIYDEYFESVSFKQWIALALAVLLSAWAKPNFMIAFAPVLLLILIADLFRRREYSLWYRFKRIVVLGSAMFPAGMFTILLSFLEFSGDNSDNGIAINIGYFIKQMEHPVAAIICSLAFAILVLTFNYKKLRDIVYQVSTGVFLAGSAEYLILTETGRRLKHGNFAWGRQIGEYLLFLYAIALFIKNIRDEEFLSNKPKLRKVYITCGAVLLTAHVICQLVYVQYIIRGHLYRM